MTTSAASGKSYILLILFGLPFAGVGIGMGVWAWHTVADAVAMRSWVKVPAIIESTSLETSTDEDGTTYMVTATYTYLYNGKTYRGTRVGVSGGYDNVGSYHQALYSRLSRAKVSQESATCFVDPNHPENAVLDPYLRWDMVVVMLVFALIFGGAGFTIIIAAIVFWRREGPQYQDRPHVRPLPP